MAVVELDAMVMCYLQLQQPKHKPLKKSDVLFIFVSVYCAARRYFIPL